MATKACSMPPLLYLSPIPSVVLSLPASCSQFSNLRCEIASFIRRRRKTLFSLSANLHRLNWHSRSSVTLNTGWLQSFGEQQTSGIFFPFTLAAPLGLLRLNTENILIFLQFQSLSVSLCIVICYRFVSAVMISFSSEKLTKSFLLL